MTTADLEQLGMQNTPLPAVYVSIAPEDHADMDEKSGRELTDQAMRAGAFRFVPGGLALLVSQKDDARFANFLIWLNVRQIAHQIVTE